MSQSYARIIACIEAGQNRVPDIADRVGMTWGTVRARLHELSRLGAVRPVRLRKSTGRARHGEKYKRYLLIRSA